MKKRVLALLMTMVLVLGMSTTALAYTNSPTVDNTPINSPVGTNSPTVDNEPTKKLDAPVINISEDGVFTFEEVEGADLYIYNIMFAFEGEEQFWPMWDKTVRQEDLKDGKYTCDILELIKEAGLEKSEINLFAGIKAVSRGSKFEESVYVKSNLWKYRLSTEQAGDLVDEALKSETPEDAKNVLSGMSNETIVNVMKEDITKIEKADKAWANKNNIKVETKSDVTTVDASKITIVGAALNAEANQDVVLSIKEPENKVEVEAKYVNAIALDIELFVAGTAKGELDIPVAITMPIPAGVEKENLVILHYHGDATEPVVIVPTINEDGTMTFYVDGFSTFVVANQVTDQGNNSNNNNNNSNNNNNNNNNNSNNNNNNNSNNNNNNNNQSNGGTSSNPQTGDTSGTTMMVSLLLLAVGVVLVMKRNAFAK